ncbi:MAG: S-layer homology domain-containing protein [Deltaproteobacteria bacterium]|nr:MAG: S-layer homology domain-containing protein [Deltaproteobacteria bacterium]
MPGFFEQLRSAVLGTSDQQQTPAEQSTARRAGAAPASATPAEPEPPLAQGAMVTRYGLARALVLPSLGGQSSKTRVVHAAMAKGIFSDASALRLEAPVTRAEAIAMAMRANGRQPLDIGLVKRVYTDVSITHWAAGHIYQATALGVVSGYEDETFKPDEGLETAHLGAIINGAASPPGKPGRFDPRVEWGERSILEGGQLSGAPNAKSLDAEALGGTRDAAASKEDRVTKTNAIVDKLSASTSKRYKPKNGLTYCNVFAHDYAFLMGAFVPRVWWDAKAIAVYQKTGLFPDAEYGKNTYEMKANQLHDWFFTWGHKFGWSHVGGVDPAALSEGQKLANDGRVVIVVGDTGKSTPGHITAVVPETDKHKAEHNAAGQVTAPNQSQAGAAPTTRGADDWFNASKYKGGKAIWVHS